VLDLNDLDFTIPVPDSPRMALAQQHDAGIAANPEIQTLVRRIVDIAHPIRIVLFGSAARDELRTDSDLDMLVVVPDGSECRKLAMQLYRDIHGIRHPFDLVVATPSLLARHADTPGLVYRHALAEGKELYAA